MEGEEKEMLRDSLDRLNMTKDEVGKFEKAFQDPKFKQMFEDYAREISDPKARAESEAYLRQIEEQNQTEAMYGEGVELIVPEESFVFKTRVKGGDQDGSKYFVNVCTSEKIARAESKKAVRDGQEGNTWSIPFSLGADRDCQDKSGEAAKVVDFILHPDTVSKCAFPPFKEMVCATALENIENTRKVALARPVSHLRMKYKASEGMEKPGVQSVRTDKGKGSGGSAAMAAGKAGGGAPKPNEPSSTTRSAFSFESAAGAVKPKPKPKPEPKEGEAGFVWPSGERVPSHSLAERGQHDLADTWGDVGHNLAQDPAARRPRELVLRCSLPEIATVASVKLEVTEREVLLVVPKRYKLELGLPFPVHDKRGRAKFDKKKRELEVVLPVVEPPRPEPKAFVEPALQQQEEQEEQEEQEQEQKKEEEGVVQAEEQGKTENQRRWNEMHAAGPPAESEAQEEAGEADRGGDEGVIAAVREAAEGGSDFVKCGSFAGALPGFSFKLGKEGLGYYREAAGVASRAEEVPTKSRGPGPEPSSSSKRNCRHGTESAAREDGFFDGWSIKEIKRWLGDRGLGTEGCLERSDLVARAMEARRGDAVPPAAPSRPLPPPAFELMRVEGVHPSGRRLQDLCSGSVRAALVSNYMIDAPWFAQEFPDLVSSEELIVCHDGKSGMRREAEALWGELKRARLRHGLGSGGRGRLVVHAPDLPIPYGTHHSKFFVLVYTDGRLRLIIHSANLLHGDCTHKTQGERTEPLLGAKNQNETERGSHFC